MGWVNRAALHFALVLGLLTGALCGRSSYYLDAPLGGSVLLTSLTAGVRRAERVIRPFRLTESVQSRTVASSTKFMRGRTRRSSGARAKAPPPPLPAA